MTSIRPDQADLNACIKVLEAGHVFFTERAYTEQRRRSVYGDL